MTLLYFQIMEWSRTDEGCKPDSRRIKTNIRHESERCSDEGGLRGGVGGGGWAVKREASVSCMRDIGPQVSADAHSRGQQ